MSELFEWEPPAFIDREAWAAFVAMRQSKPVAKKYPFTDLARNRAVEKLADMHRRGIDTREVLLTCAEFCWAGVEWGENHVVEQAQRRERAVQVAMRQRPPVLNDGPLVPTSRQGQALLALQGMKQ